MLETFGSTCHGAGRSSSRNKSRKELDYTDVLKMLADRGEKETFVFVPLRYRSYLFVFCLKEFRFASLVPN